MGQLVSTAVQHTKNHGTACYQAPRPSAAVVPYGESKRHGFAYSENEVDGSRRDALEVSFANSV